MTAVSGQLRPTSTGATEEQRLAAVTAPVRDPLWFLARQIQTKGFVADDGGSPVMVSITHATAPLNIDGVTVVGPIEPDLEAEPPTPSDLLDTTTRIRLATELLRRVADAGVPAATVVTLRAGLTATYPLHPVLADTPTRPIAAALPDAVALYAAWSAAIGADGTTGALPPLAGADTSWALIEPVARAWIAWMTDRLGPVGGPTAPPHWDAPSVGYAFSATATLGASTLTLSATDYDAGGVDWHTFDRSTLASMPAPGPPIEVRPSPVTYPGMPERGYWTMEDGTVNLDVLAAQDPARQLLVAFAHGYANDWFVVPLQVASGATMVTSLTVTDSFGSVTPIVAAVALDGPAARFRLWEVTPTAGADVGMGVRLLLPGSPPSLESAPTEEVLLARDEMANLGWLVELRTTDEDGCGVDRYRRWLSLRAEADPAFHSGAAAQPMSYRLGTSLPDFWYPLKSTGDALALASVPPGATDVSGDGVTGTLVPHTPGMTLNDEEVPRSGSRLTRVDRLLNTPTGRRVWRARRCGPGTGEASSGLRFDTIGAPAVAANLVVNPGLSLAARELVAPTVSRSGRSDSASRSWQVVNTTGGRTQARLEPATHDADGWQLHVTTSKARSGVAQQFATKDRAPTMAHASAWVYVVKGQVGLAAGPRGTTKAGALSTSTGRWELLTAPATRGPVTQVVLLAHGGPAEFVVDSVEVRAT